MFRDLNKNGQLDPYEDPRQPVAARVADLLGQMTLEEKAGLMSHTFVPVNPDDVTLTGPGMNSRASISEMLLNRHMTHFNVARIASARQTAEWHNRLQKLAAGTRLGIPVTIASDPRHAFTRNVAVGAMTGAFSLWPEPIGLAAIGDAALVQEFADIARQEYLAVGIRTALHPMADLATEPRWGRINGTFGEDAELSARLTAAYIRGFQGETLGPHSVACMTKHFPGGGPQKDGEDPHFPEGKEQIYPGGMFDYHLIPFEAAFAASTAQIMPYYGQPQGLPGIEEVGFAFSRDVITGLLREKYGFDGVVCTDWGLITSAHLPGGEVFEARAWGVEHLSQAERMVKALNAGVDQFGGEDCPEVIVGLVRSGQVTEARIDESVRRLLADKFRLGLFDNPYLDVAAAEQIAGTPAFCAAGELAQRKSIVLLKNGQIGAGRALPLAGRPRLYIEGIAAETAAAYGEVTAQPADADFAILRLQTPFEKRTGFLREHFHAGDLDFTGEELAHILEILDRVPTIVVIHLDRPAVIPEIAAGCAGLLAEFGANDAAVLDVIFGRATPVGKLPFELPASMAAVRAQKPDAPRDSENPLFPYGHGLTY
ncbi:MAG: glycoside hydrolase family 3 protein [Chloroflexi bacterium]|nr:glycoside hydrolase family 3 protein [Chloroflexota bacterium]